METDRQTGRWTMLYHRQSGRQNHKTGRGSFVDIMLIVYRWADLSLVGQTGRPIYRRTDMQTCRQTDRQANLPTDGQIGIPFCRRTDRQTCLQKDR